MRGSSGNGALRRVLENGALRRVLENGLALIVATLPPSLLLASGRLASCGLRGATAQAGAVAVAHLLWTGAKDEWGSVISTARGLLSFLLFPGLFLRLPSSLLSSSNPALLDPNSFDQVRPLDVLVHGVVCVVLSRLVCQTLETHRRYDRFVLHLRSVEGGTPAGFAQLAARRDDDGGTGKNSSKLKWSVVSDKAAATVVRGRKLNATTWQLAVKDKILQSFDGALRLAPSTTEATSGPGFSVGGSSLYVASWGSNQLADARPMLPTEHRGGEVHFSVSDGRMYMVPRTHSCGDGVVACHELCKENLKVLAVPVLS